MSAKSSYVLVTAACNEGAHIENTIRSVAAQEHPPAQWVIVSDNSTDATDAIVNRYAARYPFIRLLRLTDEHPRNFAAQVNAINAGIARLRAMDHAFIGNLDADITLAPSYFQRLLDKFRQDPRLGLAGGMIHDKCADGSFKKRIDNSPSSVAHAVQLFRRPCFEAIGGAYPPLPYGGPDTFAETMARQKGWRVTSFPDLAAFHHRPTGSAGGALRGCFNMGKVDYSIGIMPLFEMFRLLRRVRIKPYVIGAGVRLAGFLSCYCHGEKRAVPPEFIEYLRQEEIARLRNLFRGRQASDPLARVE